MIEWWLVALLAAAPIVLVLCHRLFGHQRELPLADARGFGSERIRVRRLRAGFVVLVAALIGAAAALSSRPASTLSEFVGPEKSTVIVLDVSSSVGDLVFGEVANTLRGIVDAAGSSGRIGLVLFSDVAHEALPPGTRAVELEPFIRYYEPVRERGVRPRPLAYRAELPGSAPPTRYPLNPWFGRFSGGTRISTGLAAARRALQRDAGGSGRILLVSDLQEAAEDQGAMLQELVTLAERPSIDLRVVGLPPATAADIELFRRLVGHDDAVVSSFALERRSSSGGVLSGGFPVLLVALVAVIGVIVAASELWTSPLTWRRPRPTPDPS
jgi:hypothetical protein